MIDEKAPLDEALLEHHGIKGMRWGVRKQSISTELSNKAKTKGNAVVRRVSREYETAFAIAGVAALGVAYVHSPRAQAVMKVPTSAAIHYMSNKDNRHKVFRAVKKAGVVYNKL